MKYIIVFLLLFLISSTVNAEGNVTIYDLDDIKFTGQLLFGTDSLLYIWTGTFDFDETKLEYVKAIPFTSMSKINLSNSFTWKEGIVKAMPSGILSGLTLTVFAVRNKDADEILLFNGVYNFFYCIIVGGFASASSKIPRYIDFPAGQDFNFLQKKLKKYFLLSEKDRNLINRIVAEVKP